MVAGAEGWEGRALSAVLHMLCHLGACWCLCMLGRSWLLPSVLSVCAAVSVSTHLPLCLQTWHRTVFYCLDTMKVKWTRKNTDLNVKNTQNRYIITCDRNGESDTAEQEKFLSFFLIFLLVTQPGVMPERVIDPPIHLRIACQRDSSSRQRLNTGSRGVEQTQHDMYTGDLGRVPAWNRCHCWRCFNEVVSVA